MANLQPLNSKYDELALEHFDSIDRDSVFLAHDTRFRQLLDDAFQRYKEGKALTSDEFWERLRQKRSRQENN